MTAPTLSLAVEPTRLLVDETTPLTPAVPLPHVTAPLVDDQSGLRTT